MWHNTQPYQKKSGTRQSLYEQYELPQMRALPTDLFEIKKIARAKVQRNYHIFLGEEKNFYSVPWQYAGKQAEVLYTSSTVEVYVAQKRIATHQHLYLYGREYRYQTREEHMPRHHLEWKKPKATMRPTSSNKPNSLARLLNGPCSRCSSAEFTNRRLTIVAKAFCNWLKIYPRAARASRKALSRGW